ITETPVELQNLATPSNEPAKITLYDLGDHYSFLPFPLRPGKSGKIEIKTETVKKGTSLCLVSVRNAIFMGLQQSRIVLDHDTEILTLSEEDVSDRWMSTMPQEAEQHWRQLRHAHGNVLVGGLGLGMAVGILRENPRVTSITAIEINPDVIRLVGTNAAHF